MAVFSRRTSPDLEGLAEFAKRGDRERAQFFVGRDRQISEVERLCARTLAQVRKMEPAVEGATQLVQGAPGAGKTAILSELRRRWEARGGSAPVAVVAQVADLADTARIAILIAEAVRPGSSEGWRTTRTGDVGGGVGAGVASVSGRSERSIAPDSVTLYTLRETLPPHEWPRPVCLMVDEIQKVGPEAEEVLLSLHLGTMGLPVVPVYAGLGDSYDVLQAVCSPRLSEGAVHDIGALAPEEAVEAVDLMLDRFRVDRTGAAAGWPQRLAGVSDRWPQHLHNGMRALAGGLVKAEGRLVHVDSGAVAALEREHRVKRYRRIRSPEMTQSRLLVARVMAVVPREGVADSTVLARILQEARPADDPEGEGLWLPEGMSARGFLKNLVHHGALQENDSGLLSCPIPSFRSYLIEQGGMISVSLESGERPRAGIGGSPREFGRPHPQDIQETDPEAGRQAQFPLAQAGAGGREASPDPEARLRDRVMQLAAALTERIAPTEGIHGRDMQRRIGEAMRLPSSAAVPEGDIAQLAGEIARRRAEADIRVELVRSMSPAPAVEAGARFRGAPQLHRSDHRRRYNEELPMLLAGLEGDGVTPTELEREVARAALTARGTPHESLAEAMADALGFGSVSDPEDLRRERGELLRTLAEPVGRLKTTARRTLVRRLHRAFTGPEIQDFAERRGGPSVSEGDREQVAGSVRLLLSTRITDPAPWRDQHEQLGRTTGAALAREAGRGIEPF